MQEWNIPNWLPSALTGGLAGAILTQFINWLIGRKTLRKAKVAQLKALKQELVHSLWLIEYNYDRASNEGIPYKGLAKIGTENVEHILFSTTAPLLLRAELLDRLQAYLQETVRLNNFINEYITLIPHADRELAYRVKDYMSAIKTICVPNDTYEGNDAKLSLTKQVKQLITELDKISI